VEMESMELEVRVVKPSPLPFQMILAAGWTQFVTVPQNSEPSLDIATIYRILIWEQCPHLLLVKLPLMNTIQNQTSHTLMVLELMGEIMEGVIEKEDIMEVVDIMEVAVMVMAITMEEGQEDLEDLEVQVDLEDQVDQAVLKEQACQVQEQSVTNSTLAMMFQTPRSPTWSPNGANFLITTSH